MEAKMNSLCIRAIASALPEKVMEIRDLAEEYGDKKIKRMIQSTGVERVHVVECDMTASDLCVLAAESLMEKISIDRMDIDAIVFVSISPDYRAPATSLIIQNKLGLKRECVAFDINYGCSAFIYGLYQAGMLLNSGGCKKILVCNGDVQSKLIHPKDKAMRVILGDAGTAALVEKGTSSMQFQIMSDGAGYRHLIIPAGGTRLPFSQETGREMEDRDGNIRSQNDLYMDGMEIMRFALKEIPSIVKATLKMVGWNKNDVGTFAFHQPNKLILDYIRDELEIEEASMPIVLKNTGNTASASIPLMLTLEFERLRKERRLKKVLACGFGIGLSWGTVTMDLSNTEFFKPLICK